MRRARQREKEDARVAFSASFHRTHLFPGRRGGAGVGMGGWAGCPRWSAGEREARRGAGSYTPLAKPREV